MERSLKKQDKDLVTGLRHVPQSHILKMLRGKMKLCFCNLWVLLKLQMSGHDFPENTDCAGLEKGQDSANKHPG